MSGNVLVCGGRTITDKRLVWGTLAEIQAQEPIARLIEGGCRGVDTLAGEWAIENGIQLRVVKADWARYGRSAGPRRNALMVDSLSDGDRVVAFWDGQSRGTANTIQYAKGHRTRLRVRVERVGGEG